MAGDRIPVNIILFCFAAYSCIIVGSQHLKKKKLNLDFSKYTEIIFLKNLWFTVDFDNLIIPNPLRTLFLNSLSFRILLYGMYCMDFL